MTDASRALDFQRQVDRGLGDGRANSFEHAIVTSEYSSRMASADLLIPAELEEAVRTGSSFSSRERAFLWAAPQISLRLKGWPQRSLGRHPMRARAGRK
jgi:hypothetical protein